MHGILKIGCVFTFFIWPGTCQWNVVIIIWTLLSCYLRIDIFLHQHYDLWLFINHSLISEDCYVSKSVISAALLHVNPTIYVFDVISFWFGMLWPLYISVKSWLVFVECLIFGVCYCGCRLSLLTLGSHTLKL